MRGGEVRWSGVCRSSSGPILGRQEPLGLLPCGFLSPIIFSFRGENDCANRKILRC